MLRTEDLDPVYCALQRVELKPVLKHRLCLAYWCFYHLGVAAYICEQTTSTQDFWSLMLRAARNQPEDCVGLPAPRWPRGTERRHFRGQQAVRAVEHLHARRLAPEVLVAHWFVKPEFTAVAKAVQQQRGFGPWIAFKVADMGERVLGYPVQFQAAHLGIYRDPRQGAALIVHDDWRQAVTDAELVEVIEYLVSHWRDTAAPPARDRAVNVQEAETILCKYKSHVKGHYPLGKDTREVRHGLHGWGALADRLAAALPPST